jgi:DNA-binding transcriptional ArsR family regulator
MSATTEQPTADVFQAIADPTRRGLLDLLAAGEQPVTRLAAPFPMSRPAISQHLRVLRRAGLVSERRVGRERRYRLQPEPLREVSDWLRHYERFWLGKLAALGDYLDEEAGR